MALVVLIPPRHADGFSVTVAPGRSYAAISKIASPSSWSAAGAPASSALSLARIPRDEDDGDNEYARIPRGGRRRQYPGNDDQDAERDTSFRSRFDDDLMGAADRLEAKGILDDYSDEDYEMFSNVIIPNPILDSIDPDGAADRFPELARDPKFWFEIGLFLAFINFLSFIGPR